MGTEHWERYSVDKASEGGVSQKDVRAGAKAMGLKVRFMPSCYVGQYGCEVNTSNRGVLDKFETDVLGF